MLFAHTREKKIFLSRALPKIAFFSWPNPKTLHLQPRLLAIVCFFLLFPPGSPLSTTLALTDLRAHKKGCKIAEHQPTSQEENPQHTFFLRHYPTSHTHYTSFFGSDFSPFPRTHNAR